MIDHCDLHHPAMPKSVHVSHTDRLQEGCEGFCQTSEVPKEEEFDFARMDSQVDVNCAKAEAQSQFVYGAQNEDSIPPASTWIRSIGSAPVGLELDLSSLRDSCSWRERLRTLTQPMQVRFDLRSKKICLDTPRSAVGPALDSGPSPSALGGLSCAGLARGDGISVSKIGPVGALIGEEITRSCLTGRAYGQVLEGAACSRGRSGTLIELDLSQPPRGIASW